MQGIFSSHCLFASRGPPSRSPAFAYSINLWPARDNASRFTETYMRSLYFALCQKAQAWWQHYYCPIEITLTIRRRPRPKRRRVATIPPQVYIDGRRVC